jgi:hypothetical protein
MFGSRLLPIAVAANGWSIYGAQRAQPVATGRKCDGPHNDSNKRIRNRWQPMATVSERMVRRGGQRFESVRGLRFFACSAPPFVISAASRSAGDVHRTPRECDFIPALRPSVCVVERVCGPRLRCPPSVHGLFAQKPRRGARPRAVGTKWAQDSRQF